MFRRSRLCRRGACRSATTWRGCRLVGGDRKCDHAVREDTHGGRKLADETPRRRFRSTVVGVEGVARGVAAADDAFGGKTSDVA